MPALKITVHGDDMARVLKAAADKAPQVLAQAINAVAKSTRDAMVPVLAAQTGLPERTIHKALKVTAANAGILTAKISSHGGDIALKYFAPYETPGGVSAAPRGLRKVYPHTFMKAGAFPNRVDKPGWNGQVFKRAAGVTRNGKGKFQVAKSGEYIPKEMISGATAETFTKVSTAELGKAVDTAIAGLLGGKK